MNVLIERSATALGSSALPKGSTLYIPKAEPAARCPACGSGPYAEYSNGEKIVGYCCRCGYELQSSERQNVT